LQKGLSVVYYIDDSFKQWVLFQPGTYWIYLNEKSNTEDSLFVDSTQSHYFQPPPPTQIQHEGIAYSISNGFISSAVIGCGRNSSYLNLKDFNSDNYALGSGVIYNDLNEISPSCWLIEKIDTFIVNNNKFLNVVHTRDTNNYYPHNHIKDYYFAKNIGLLKFSIKTNTIDSTWSILRWHINQ
jgi:hypothetical protein